MKTLLLFLSLLVVGCAEVDVPATGVSPTPAGAAPCVSTPGVCASRVGLEFKIEFVALPGNDCGPIAGGGATFADSASCEWAESAAGYENTIYWDADGRAGHGLIVYTDHYEARLGANCNGAYATTYTVR